MDQWPDIKSYLFFKEVWVPLVIGLIGFGGVIVTLIVGSCLARRQHHRQAADKANGLLSALLSELRGVQKYYRDSSNDMRTGKPVNLFTTSNT